MSKCSSQVENGCDFVGIFMKMLENPGSDSGRLQSQYASSEIVTPSVQGSVSRTPLCSDMPLSVPNTLMEITPCKVAECHRISIRTPMEELNHTGNGMEAKTPLSVSPRKEAVPKLPTSLSLRQNTVPVTPLLTPLRQVARLRTSGLMESGKETHLKTSLPQRQEAMLRTPTSLGLKNEASLSTCLSTSPTSVSAENRTPVFGETPTTRCRTKRKFPGPAGMLPVLGNPFGSPKNEIDITVGCSGEKSPRNHLKETICTQTGDEDFAEELWRVMQKDLENEQASSLSHFRLSWVQRKATMKQLPKGKVPFLCVIVKSVTFTGADAIIVVKDPTGEMQGTVHRQVMDEHEMTFKGGAGVFLNQCGVFSPSPRSHYLNITSRNLLRIYVQTEDSKVSSHKVLQLSLKDIRDRIDSPESTQNPINVTKLHHTQKKLVGGQEGSTPNIRNVAPAETHKLGHEASYSPKFTPPGKQDPTVMSSLTYKAGQKTEAQTNSKRTTAVYSPVTSSPRNVNWQVRTPAPAGSSESADYRATQGDGGIISQKMAARVMNSPIARPEEQPHGTGDGKSVTELISGIEDELFGDF
ncbi:PREDICTED: uncharacterized protein LOC106810461 [Priapulus caudatus]|uniref:Uncharacterized protein LOC106810461 n=1 Tax=Priapulus caudatus TaxID=37621 RepID=A0ABM1EAV5_PRICU|nr:PREDICTED: uncharacterized protein LOC106810461 [Priapulus caudatus]